MTRCLLCETLLVSIVATTTLATTFTIEITPTSPTTVGPNQTVSYQITAALSGDPNLGLAGFSVDLQTDLGSAPAQATPGPNMATFVKDAGITNPSGFGGTDQDDDLVQIGGAQNSFGNPGTPPYYPYPSGAVVTGIGIGNPVVLADGAITAPATEGTYTIELAGPMATVLTENTGTFYKTELATSEVGPNGSFTIEVTSAAWHALTVTEVNGGFGTVEFAPEPNDANTPMYPEGTPVSLTAEPNEGKEFRHWEIYDDPNLMGDANYAVIDANLTTTIVMDQDRGVTAVFKCGSSVGPLMPLLLLTLGAFVVLRRRRPTQR